MKKKSVLLVSMLLTGVLFGCAGESKVETNTISINKKGVVTGTIVEDFSQPYYDQEELKKMIDNEVAAYNSKAGADSVTVETYEVTDGKVTLSMDYASYKDYADMNEKDFFVGTVSQAYDAGYSFESIKSADGTTTVSEKEILEMGEEKIVICDEAIDVRVSGKISYISGNAEIKDNKTASIKEEGVLAFILYE